MSEAVIIALISGLCVGVPSVITTLLSNRSNNKLTLYRIDQLEEKVDKHNSVIERTFKLEEKIQEMTNDIKELKSYHKPN
jgi:uncharacterized membrane-anchored protein YhcB (DUF1043 family)